MVAYPQLWLFVGPCPFLEVAIPLLEQAPKSSTQDPAATKANFSSLSPL